MFDVVGISVLLLLLIGFGWLGRRAWRARRPVVKWIGALVSGMLALVVGVVLGAALVGYGKLNRSYDNPVPQLSVDATSERVARGARFEPFCGGCHAPEAGAPLTGNDFLGEDAPPIGTFYAPNLTPVHLASWSDGEIVRAIREGIHRSGRSLLIMPASTFRRLSDADAQAVVAYLRSLPPEGEATPPNNLNVLGAVLANIAPIFEAQPPITEPVEAPSPGPTAEYGAYLASLTCGFCHGDDLLGDPEMQAPPLIHVPLVWEEAEFLQFMRTGVRPDSSSVDGELMPWEVLSRFLREDDELRAVYAHLKTLEVE